MTSRKRKSLSSILKTQSPSRTALLDLNPNLNGPPSDETTQLDLLGKKKRRSSRRVSFAETYQVKEFMKDSDRKELGMWDDSQEGTTHQELPDLQQANNPSDCGPKESCSDPAHHITGLETLLSGPIKQEAHSMTSSGHDPYATTDNDVQSTSSAENLHQYSQDVNLDQRKSDIDETCVKSSFLKSFIAADSCRGKGSSSRDLSAFSAPPSVLSYPPTSGQQHQEEPPQESSFRSSFLQAFVAAGPSSSSSEVAGSKKPSANADDGMDLTNCFYSREFPDRYERKEEKVGDITRIFGGQGDGFENDNGMDMTTCIGGFDTLHKKLERPAAESTRIFTSDNTDNMDLTACLTDFGGTSTSRTLGRTMNQTGNLNFTQVFGKLSESDYADLPHESTAGLLKRIDDAIAGSDGSGAGTTQSYVDSSESGSMNILHRTRENTRKSIALDTIQEVSSSTGSVLNVTSGDKSSASAAAPLEACAEEDEMDITTCSNYTKEVRLGSGQQEQSRVPDNEDTAAMEMTCAVGNTVHAVGPSKVVSSSTVAKESLGDHTRVFDAITDDSAEMEMTCAIDQPLVTGTQAKDGCSRAPSAVDEDKTRVFNLEDAAEMEMTCVVSGANSLVFSAQNVHKGEMMSSLTARLGEDKENVPSGSSKEVSSSTSAEDICEGHSRVFDPAADDSAEMEMTCAINQPLVPGSQIEGAPSTVPPSACNEDKTKVFGSEDNAAMEMTCAIGGLQSSAFSVQSTLQGSVSSSKRGIGLAGQSRGVPSSATDVESLEDRTRVFNDSGDMEMTCAVSQPLITGNQAKEGRAGLPADFDEDKTKVFNSDETAAMEMTCAINQPLINQSQVKVGPRVLPPAFYEDKTRVFNSDDTAAMEMTCVMSGANTSAFAVQNVHQSKMRSSIRHPSVKENTLSAFSHLVHNESSKRTEDTTHFESTACLGDLPEGLAYQMRRKREKQGMDKLQTDDTAHMEITECMSAPPNTSYSEHAAQPQVSKGNKDSYGENTCYFSANNGDSMHMTECLDNQLGGSRGMMTTHQDQEQTKLFQSEDTGNMEMTTCVGALQTVPPVKTSAKVFSDEQTRVFNNEDTANMEMTCAGGVLPLLPSNIKETHKKSSEEQVQSDDTANMEITACGGAFPSMSSNLNTSRHAGEPLTSDFLGKTLPYMSRNDDTTKRGQTQSDISAVTFPRMKGEMPEVHQSSTDTGVNSESTNDTNLRSDVAAPSNTEQAVKDEVDPMQQQKPEILQETIKQRDGDINISSDIPHDKTSDTYTLSKSVIQQDEDLQLEAEQDAQEKLLEGRNSDTFTISASSLSASGKRKFSLTEGTTTRTSSNSSEEGQTKREGSSSSNSSDMESHASFMKDSIILPDWIDAEDEKGILDELPIDNDNTEDLCLTSTKRPRIDESGLTASHMDASYLTSNLSHLPLSSDSGASSVADFLQMFFKFSDLPIGKRSIMCPTKISEPTTLSSHLEDACLIKPKADMYEWAIKFLTPAVEEDLIDSQSLTNEQTNSRLRKAVRTQETKHLEESAPIIKEMQSAGPEKCAEILKKGKSLQKYCTASSKAKMREWRLQMVNNTKAAMQDSSQHLEGKVAKLTSSVSALNEQLQQLTSVDSALDDAIRSLEEIKLPTEEEKAEWLANSERLTTMETKLQEEELAVQDAESERGRLEAEIKSLEESRTKLEAEREELSRLENGSRQADLELENTKSEIVLLHSFQEWRLEAFCKNNYNFSFLNKSILLSLQYGETASGVKLTDLVLQSVLAGDACGSAKLAHSLFFSRISVDKLKTLYPTLADLPQMMQHLSELAGQVRLLEAEVSRLDFWHPVTTTQNRLSIEFSSIEAHSMFHIHLDMPPDQYPFAAIPHSCVVKIGKISEESIKATIDSVQPGWRYITRITEAVKQLLHKHSA